MIDKKNNAKGRASENQVFEQMQKTNKSLFHHPYYFSKYDFEDNNTLYELKTRFDMTKNKYPTTLIPRDKIIETQKKIVFLFRYMDEPKNVYSIEYNKEVFDQQETKKFHRTDRGFDVLKDHIFIDVNLLQLFCTIE